MPQEIVAQAAALIQAGHTAEAQKLLEPYIAKNLQDIPAWLLEAETWPTPAGKVKALELCLHYNPEAAEVKQALADLKARSPKTKTPSVKGLRFFWAGCGLLALTACGLFLALSGLGGTLANLVLPGLLCRIVSAEPAAGATVSYAQLQAGLPFVIKMQSAFIQPARPTHITLRAAVIPVAGPVDPSTTYTPVAYVARVDDIQCFGICQTTAQGLLHPEGVVQGKLTLAISVGLVDTATGLGTLGSCPTQYLQYSVEGRP